MNIKHTAAIAAIFLGAFSDAAQAASEPVPGIDIIVRKTPGGIAMKATTDKAGNFVFDNLGKGTYVLSVSAPQTKSSINTSRSNIRHPSKIAANGVQEVTATVLLGGQAASAEIEITAAKGKITGTVTRAEAPKESGAAPVKDAPKKATKEGGAK